MKHLATFILFLFLWNLTSAQNLQVSSENFTDFLYQDIFNEVKLLKRSNDKITDYRIVCEEAVVIKKAPTIFLIKPKNQVNLLHILVYDEQNNQKIEELYYVTKELPEPNISIAPHRNHNNSMDILTMDSLVAKIELNNGRSIQIGVKKYEIVFIKKTKEIGHIQIESNRLDQTQKQTLKKYMFQLGPGDKIEFRNIILSNIESEKLIKLLKVQYIL